MSGRHSGHKNRQPGGATPFPLDQAIWRAVVKELQLCRQHARTVELILCSMKDKEIATEMGLGVPTVRTYLGRIFARLGVRDRTELVVRVFTTAQRITTQNVITPDDIAIVVTRNHDFRGS